MKFEGPVNLRQILDNFVLIERLRYRERHNNRFAGAIAKVQRSHTFLLVTETRYSQLAAQLLVVDAQKQSWIERMTEGAASGAYKPGEEEQAVSRQILEICTELGCRLKTSTRTAKRCY